MADSCLAKIFAQKVALKISTQINFHPYSKYDLINYSTLFKPLIYLNSLSISAERIFQILRTRYENHHRALGLLQAVPQQKKYIFRRKICISYIVKALNSDPEGNNERTLRKF